MDTSIQPVQGSLLPIISSLSKELVEQVDQKASYEDVWRTVEKMAQALRNQAFVNPAALIKPVEADRDAGSDMFVLMCTIHPLVLRSLCMGTIALDFWDKKSPHWDLVHETEGPGTYAVGIAIRDREGKFLTRQETKDLIRALQRYRDGCLAWVEKGDAYGESQLAPQQVSDLDYALAIDREYPRRRGSNATDMDDSGPEAQGDTPRPRFARGTTGLDLTRNIDALIAMFEKRCVEAGDDEQIQSPIAVGNSNDTEKRKQAYRPSLGSLGNTAKVYGLTLSCLSYNGLSPQEVFVPIVKAWQVSQINLGEVLVTLLAGSLVSVGGFNVHAPGLKKETDPPGDDVFEDTRRLVDRAPWFLSNLEHAKAKQTEHAELVKSLEEMQAISESDLTALERKAEEASNRVALAKAAHETALSDAKEQIRAGNEVHESLKSSRSLSEKIKGGLFKDLVDEPYKDTDAATFAEIQSRFDSQS